MTASQILALAIYGGAHLILGIALTASSCVKKREKIIYWALVLFAFGTLWVISAIFK